MLTTAWPDNWLTVIDVNTGVSSTLYQDTGVAHFGHPTWSPDGTTVVFSKHQDTWANGDRHELWLVDADG
ncbi:MAG: hypothetical protein CO095_06155, partial [Armatimonadetes bacterium CG_4_9_14_3_um_filter_58_7]